MPEKPDKKPDPQYMNDVFVKELRRLAPGVQWTVEKPVVREVVSQKEASGFFYTFTLEEKKAFIEWREKTGFSISSTKGVEFGSDPKNLIMNPYIAAKRVAEMLGSTENAYRVVSETSELP